MKWIRIAFLVLLVLTVGVAASYVVVAMTYPKIDYSTGTAIAVHRLAEEPETYVVIENDTFVAEAVETGKRVFLPSFVQTADGEWVWRPTIEVSEWEAKGQPDYIRWLPDGNYYFVSIAGVDGPLELLKELPPPTATAGWLSIPWIGLLITTAYQVKRNRKCEK